MHLFSSTIICSIDRFYFVAKAYKDYRLKNEWFVLNMFVIVSLFMFSRLSVSNLKMTTKYQVSWEIMRNWLTGVSNDNYKAFCKVCWQEFSVKQNGKEKVKQHEKWVKHWKAVNESKSQATLGCSQKGSITVSKSSYKTKWTCSS